jgi:hypothetical protein
MKIVLLGLAGLFLGATVGAALGVGAGLIWTEVFKTSNFEGYSGMLVFFGFMPAGAVLGSLGGAIGLGYLAYRGETVQPPKAGHPL